MATLSRLKKPLLWTTAGAALALCAALAARPAARETLRRFSPEIESWLTTAVGNPVKLGAIEPRFDFLEPIFEISEGQVLDPATHEAILRFKDLRIALDPWKSLAALRPVIGSLRLGDLEASRPFP